MKAEISRIPKEWEVVEIKKISDFIRGTEPGSRKYNTQRIGVRFIRVSDISKKVLESVFVNESSNLVLCNSNDILLVLDGVPGVVAKGFEGAISSGIRIVKPKSNKLDKEFLFYILQHKIVQNVIENYTTGTTIKHASRSIDFIRIPLPPLPEQHAIAQILSTVDSTIQKVDEIIAKTERLKKGLMQELLTKGIGHKEFKDSEIGRIPKEWEVKKIADVCKVVTGGTPSTSHPEYFGGNIKWLKSGDIKGLYIYDTEEKITELGVENSNAKIYPPGGVAIALSGRGLTRGRTAVIKDFMACSQSVAIMIPNSRLMAEFLHYNLASRYMEIRNLTGHYDRSGLNLSIVSKIKIPIPIYEEQQKIAEILSTVDKKLELERKRKEKLERIKKGLMNDLLIGKKRLIAK